MFPVRQALIVYAVMRFDSFGKFCSEKKGSSLWASETSIVRWVVVVEYDDICMVGTLS